MANNDESCDCVTEGFANCNASSDCLKEGLAMFDIYCDCVIEGLANFAVCCYCLTCDTSAPVASQIADMELMLEIRWARNALAASLESSLRWSQGEVI